jgi:hypothetical protein
MSSTQRFKRRCTSIGDEQPQGGLCWYIICKNHRLIEKAWLLFMCGKKSLNLILPYLLSCICLLSPVVCMTVYTTPAFGLSADDIIELKKSGVEDLTIELIIKEQSDLLGIINIREIIMMKQAGVSDTIIRALVTPVKRERAVKEYGTHVDQIKEISTKDLIQLKKIGFDDRLIEAIIKIQKDNLWPYLFDMGFIVCPESYRR